MWEASVHTRRTRDGTPAALGRLGDEPHHRNRRARLDERVRRGYHPRRGGCYDSEEDRSPSPEPPGPQAFSRAIRRAPFPARFRAPTTITKYSGETRPELWLADYRLACQLGGTDDDNLIICNLPPVPLRRCPGLAGASASCADLQLGRPGQGLRWKFSGHVRAPWELLGSLKLPPAARGIPVRVHPTVFKAAHRAAQHHQLRCHRGVPRRHHLPRPGEQTRAQDSHQGERVDGHRHQVRLWSGGGRGHLPKGRGQRGTKKKAKKKAQAKRDAADADLVAAAEHRNPQKPPGGANLFDKMLKESCPYHQGPVKHTLEECVMLQSYFHKAGPPAGDGKGPRQQQEEGR
jgi:hypothetical protein